MRRLHTKMMLLVAVVITLNISPWFLLRNANRSVISTVRAKRVTDFPIQSSPMNPKNSTFTLGKLLETYNATRLGRVCAKLAKNVSIDLSDSFAIGMLDEHVRQKNSTRPKFAYVMMVSNHKYIDGSLVLADSIRHFSPLVQNGTAETVLIINQRINTKMIPILLAVFHRVLVMNTLGSFVEKSYYKTTFDKMYLFSLTSYEGVIFLDADSLVVGNPDKLFQKLTSKHPLVAVGSSDYFQTALLILRPNLSIFTDLYLEFRYGEFGYNQWRARDGILFRNCLLEHHGNIEHPTDSIFHFYGFVKPWFNKDAKYGKAEKQEFGREYKTWWERYELLHRSHFVHLTLEEQWKDPSSVYGGSASKNKFQQHLSAKDFKLGVSVSDFMWMQRYSVGSEYLRPTFLKYAILANESINRDVRVASIPGMDCETSCRKLWFLLYLPTTTRRETVCVLVSSNGAVSIFPAQHGEMFRRRRPWRHPRRCCCCHRCWSGDCDDSSRPRKPQKPGAVVRQLVLEDSG